MPSQIRCHFIRQKPMPLGIDYHRNPVGKKLIRGFGSSKNQCQFFFAVGP